MQTRGEFLGSMLAPLVAPAARPNVVFILVDDLRWDDLGAAGHPFVKTPNIDRIAAEGARFRNAFVTTPLCSPSRASFLTGQYAHRHGIIDNTDRSERSRQLKTFPMRLHQAGYETAFIGKWHMGVDDTPRPGFDHWVSFPGQGQCIDPELNVDGRRGIARGYITDLLTTRAVDFIRRARQKPFLLYLAHKAIHPNIVQHADGSTSGGLGGAADFIAAERHQTLYRGARIPRRPNWSRAPEGKPALQRKIGNLPPLGPGTVTPDEVILNRLRMLASVDEGAGLILKVLAAEGQSENTVVVFTGDNGYFYGEHGLSSERRLAYEEAARIPLLIRYPRAIRPGKVVDEFALNIDAAPTVLDLAGVAPEPDMDGRSLVPPMAGRAAGWRRSFLIEYFSDRVARRILNMGYQALRTERWKYIHYTELQEMDELYNLTSDPYEMQNVITERGTQPALAELKRELRRLTGG